MTSNSITLSVMDVIRELPDRKNNRIFMYLCWVVYIITVYILPQFIIVSLIGLWIIPLQFQWQNTILTDIFVVLNSFNGLLVVWLGSVSGALSQRLVSQWIVNENFPEVCDLIFEDTGSDCFTMVGFLLDGAWFMLFAALSYWVVFGYTWWVWKVKVCNH